MPLRLWLMLLGLCAAILTGSLFALYTGIQEVRLCRSGPRKSLAAEEITAETRGWLQVAGCARHDLEVAISPEGTMVKGERGLHDRVYFALTSRSECDEVADAARLKVYALVEAQNAGQQGLSPLYDRSYTPPPVAAWVEGVIGFGAGDRERERLARAALAKRHPALSGVPLLIKDKRPGVPAVAYATTAVGVHGVLLILILGYLGLRRLLRGDRLPDELVGWAE